MGKMITFAINNNPDMKSNNFFKWVLAVLVGLLVWGIIKGIFFLMMIGALAGSATVGASSTPVIPKEGALVMDMGSLVITEQTEENIPSLSMGSLNSLGGGQMSANVGLYDAVKAIHKAASDPGVKFILLKVDNLASSVTKLSDIRVALSEFRKSGKPVVAYAESYSSGSYYLASVADKIYTVSHHGGNHSMLGLSGRMIFLKDLLDRIGVNYQLIRHGKYKSAGEMYVKSAPSPENMEQNQVMVDSMWETISKETAEARGISVDSLNYFIDNLAINFPEDMVRHNLADEILSVEGYKDKMATLAGKEKFKDVKFIPFKDYMTSKVKPNTAAKGKIAVIYADGNIVDQPDQENISGDRFASVIAKVRADSTIKAVVLRVNSPGGTVLAANKIKEEIDLTRAVKPVVASYGDYAASGGYWISASCDHIFSGAATLTGSIGCFSAIPEFGKTVKDIARINIVPVKSHKHSDMFSLMRPFDQDETDMMQEYVDDIYTSFVNLVAEGRDMTYESVDEIAQGRVWTGADALRLGLVDELGTLEDAIAYAASLGGNPDVDSWNVVGYPKPLTAIEKLMAQFGGKTPDAEEVVENILEGTPFEGVAKSLMDWQRTWAKGNGPLVFARLPFEIEIK